MRTLFTISGRSVLVTDKDELEQLIREANEAGVTYTVSHL